MSQTNRVQAPQTMFAVALDDGSTWTGTEAQLRKDHPDWVPYAHIVQPRDPRQSYSYIDEQLGFPHQASGHRAKQPLPRKEYNPAELARIARHQAREEERQRSKTTNKATADEEEIEDEDIDGNGDVYPPQVLTRGAIRRQPLETFLNGATVHNTSPPPAPYRHPIPPRRSAQYQQPPQQQQPYADALDELETERPPKRKRRGLHLHWLSILAIGMLFMLALVVVGNAVSNWWTIHQDDITYGRPRTFQTDAVVGHNDSTDNPSHFEALNRNRHIEVIEWPGGDSSKMRIYNVTTLFGNGQELTPITLSFKDVTGNGLLDMEIHIQGQTIVFINENGQFRPLKPTEHVHI